MDLQKNIAFGLQKLRRERGLSQVELAKVLTVSQPTLSLIESGKGSLTAEQFLYLLQHYNLALDYFFAKKKEDNIEAELQNALARFGAKHLRESILTSLSLRYRDVNELILAVLSSPLSSRHIAALAPVVLRQINTVLFGRLFTQLHELGQERRLFWFFEMLDTAFALRWQDRLTTLQKRGYRLAMRVITEEFELLLRQYQERHPSMEWRDDILVRGTTSSQSRNDSTTRDVIAKNWRIMTELKANDFYKSLVEADENDC